MQGEGPAELGVQGPAWRDAVLGFHCLEPSSSPLHLPQGCTHLLGTRETHPGAGEELAAPELSGV